MVPAFVNCGFSFKRVIEVLWWYLQVVEEVGKDMLGNFEGSGEDRSQVSEGPKEGSRDTKDIDETRPMFMRAKLWVCFKFCN